MRGWKILFRVKELRISKFAGFRCIFWIWICKFKKFESSGLGGGQAPSSSFLTPKQFILSIFLIHKYIFDIGFYFFNFGNINISLYCPWNLTLTNITDYVYEQSMQRSFKKKTMSCKDIWKNYLKLSKVIWFCAINTNTKSMILKFRTA